MCVCVSERKRVRERIRDEKSKIASELTRNVNLTKTVN
jgi:hypothetical protein